MATTPQRWTLSSERYRVYGLTDIGNQLIEKFATRELAERFAQRIIAAGRFMRCAIRDAMADKDEVREWIVQSDKQLMP
jgi:hypothetical protein